MSCQKLSKVVVKSWQKLSKVIKSCQKLSETVPFLGYIVLWEDLILIVGKYELWETFILIVGGFNGFYGNGLIVGGFNGFYGNRVIVGGFNPVLWERINCGRLIWFVGGFKYNMLLLVNAVYCCSPSFCTPWNSEMGATHWVGCWARHCEGKWAPDYCVNLTGVTSPHRGEIIIIMQRGVFCQWTIRAWQYRSRIG